MRREKRRKEKISEEISESKTRYDEALVLHRFSLNRNIMSLCVSPGKEYTQYSLHNVHLQYPWVMSLTKHPHLLQVVTAVLGPDVILLDSRFICKYPTLTSSDIQENEEEEPKPKAGENGLPYVAWHQDMR